MSNQDEIETNETFEIYYGRSMQTKNENKILLK